MALVCRNPALLAILLIAICISMASGVQEKSDSLDQRYCRVAIGDKFFFIVKIADGQNMPDTESLETNLIAGNRHGTLCYVVICRAYGIEGAQMKEDGDTFPLEKPISIFKMPCASQYIAFLHDSLKNQELLLYNSKRKVVSVIPLAGLCGGIRKLPFFWVQREKVRIDWKRLPHEIWSEKCYKCK